MRHLAILYALALTVGGCSPAPVPSGTIPSATATPATGVATPASGLATPTASATLPTAARVSMGDNFFTPNEVTIAVGTTVVWQIDAGDGQHDVMATGGSFVSISPMARGIPFSYTFTKAGEYAYVCSFHIPEGMTGKIVVR